MCSVLGRHEGLRVHSGSVGDGVIELAQRRVVSRIDGALLIGSQRLFDFARDNERVRLRSSEYTHGAACWRSSSASSPSIRRWRST